MKTKVESRFRGRPSVHVIVVQELREYGYRVSCTDEWSVMWRRHKSIRELN